MRAKQILMERVQFISNNGAAAVDLSILFVYCSSCGLFYYLQFLYVLFQLIIEMEKVSNWDICTLRLLAIA